jgi:hypothetical protein
LALAQRYGWKITVRSLLLIAKKKGEGKERGKKKKKKGRREREKRGKPSHIYIIRY